LRRFHQFLWSKLLPSGKPFDLDISGPKPFLVHRSELGEFQLTSDAITHTYRDVRRIKPFLDQLAGDRRDFVEADKWPISECILFPGRKVNGQMTINGARGTNRKIGDRFDLTLECIRRFYKDEQSPLSEVLDRYANFFSLFMDFKGYVDFFLLQDLVSVNYEAVNFYLPFTDFQGSPLPHDLASYDQYLDGVLAFSAGRAKRMTAWRHEKSQGSYG
jgi:hypothetical protein